MYFIISKICVLGVSMVRRGILECRELLKEGLWRSVRDEAKVLYGRIHGYLPRMNSKSYKKKMHASCSFYKSKRFDGDVV